MRPCNSPNLMALSSAVSEKRRFIWGLLLTRICVRKQVTQPIVHVLDEWAKVARITLGGLSSLRLA